MKLFAAIVLILAAFLQFANIFVARRTHENIEAYRHVFFVYACSCLSILGCIILLINNFNGKCNRRCDMIVLVCVALLQFGIVSAFGTVM